MEREITADLWGRLLKARRIIRYLQKFDTYYFNIDPGTHETRFSSEGSFCNRGTLVQRLNLDLGT